MLPSRQIVLLAAVLQFAVNVAQSKPLSVRVQSRSGAPRIMVNGQPVRARMFWGQPQPGLITILPKAQIIQYEFTPLQIELKTATMHLRLGHAAGDVYLDNIRVEDLTTGAQTIPVCDFEDGQASFTKEWLTWPPDDKNIVGKVSVEPGVGQDGSAGLHVQIHNPPGGVWPDFFVHHIPNLKLEQAHRYRVSMWMKSTTQRSLQTAFYRPGEVYEFLGWPPGHFESQVKLAASAGANFVSTTIPFPWPKPGQAENWCNVDAILDIALKANPKALLIPRIQVYAPEWWLEQHPDEKMRWESGTHPNIASPASELFKKEASIRLQKLVQHLENTLGEHIAGYHPNGQMTGEWFYQDSWDRPLNGYSTCDTLAFRSWLKSRYTSDLEIRQAWNDQAVTLNTAEVPSAEKRHRSPGGIFRDPETEQQVMDFVHFQQKSMADSVCGYAKVVRKATSGRKLVLAFYGYVFEFAPMSTGAGSSGHYALRQILDSPDIDIVCSPISYGDRGLGQAAPCMTAAESVALAGKMWLNEDDTRTSLVTEKNFSATEQVLTSVDQTNQLLIRNVAQESTRNFATWWADLAASGWFDSPGMWAQMKLMKQMDDYYINNAKPFRPEIALVLDEQSMLMLSDGSEKVGGPLVLEARRELSRIGAPYGQYLLDDVIHGKVKAKMYVFAAAWKLDAKQRASLLKATKGSVCIWAYAPGYFDGLKPSLGSMKQLTGFAIKLIDLPQSYAIPESMELKDSIFYVRPEKMSPTFSVTDAIQSEIQAKYPDGSVAVAMRKREGGVTVFWGTPGWNRVFLRKLAAKAGVHRYTQLDCVVYANGDVLALHATKAGAVQIDTRRQDPVYDLMTGRKLGMGPKLTLPMSYAQTRVLKIGPMR